MAMIQVGILVPLFPLTSRERTQFIFWSCFFVPLWWLTHQPSIHVYAFYSRWIGLTDLDAGR